MEIDNRSNATETLQKNKLIKKSENEKTKRKKKKRHNYHQITNNRSQLDIDMTKRKQMHDVHERKKKLIACPTEELKVH